MGLGISRLESDNGSHVDGGPELALRHGQIGTEIEGDKGLHGARSCAPDV